MKECIAKLFLNTSIDHFLEIVMLIQESMNRGLNIMANPEASAVVYPHKGRVYVQFFGTDEHHITLDDNFIDYHYQNSTDMPDDVTEEEWLEREETWEAILGGEAPAQRGFAYEFTNTYIAWDIAEYVMQEKGLLKRKDKP